MRQNKNERGFIPMIILLVLLIGAVVWFSYKHVNDAHKQKLIQKASQYENSINQ